MLGNVLCWVIALGLILSNTSDKSELYTKTLIALGFIFVGVLSKAVDVYHDIHKRYIAASTPAEKSN